MRYVALLRGINVGGNTMINMADLRKSFESLGFKNVASYVNSGNLAFDSRKAAEPSLVKKLEDVIERDFGKMVHVMVREQAQLSKIFAANPFNGEYKSHKEMHVLFLKDEFPDGKLAEIREAAPAKERFSVAGREIYCHLPMGVADSLMGRGLVEKKLKLAVTARNWRTIERLATL